MNLHHAQEGIGLTQVIGDATAHALPLSVVVPVCDNASTLREVLKGIRASNLADECYEIIVVDDASADGSVAIAARYADTIVRLGGRRSGPAYARNRGVETARGAVVAFVDPNVLVAPDTLPEMLRALAGNPRLDAISASRDENSGPTNFWSRYWNLLLRYGEQRHAGRCAQFAPGCGAVRRQVLLDAGMYDEWRFPSASLENVELGERMLRAGYEVLLSPQLKVTHLTRWTLISVCAEIWQRSQALARSLGYVRMSASAPGDVVLTLIGAATPALAVLAIVVLAAAFVPEPYPASNIVFLLAALVVINVPLHRFYSAARGIGFAVLSAPLHPLVEGVAALALFTGWVLRGLLGDVSPDATTQAYSEVGLEIWPPVPRQI